MKTITKIAYPVFGLFALVCPALSPQARAVCQEGCLTNLNTVLGDDALLNTTSFSNTAVGSEALMSNTSGYGTAVGSQALSNNTTGTENTATGASALGNNTIGGANTAMGQSALAFNTTGGGNTAIGRYALFSNTSGVGNIAVGHEAGVCILGSNNIDIGHFGLPGESGTIRIGSKFVHNATLIAGISGATVPTGVAVIVDRNGRLGTTTSSARFKDAIKPMDKASEAILALKPVTFRYKQELDPSGIPQFGLVAEQVEKVNPDLVARDEQGRPYTVRYEAVNAMLLNEFLKEHRRVEEQTRLNQEQEATIADLRAALKHQGKQIATLTSQMQRVSDQLQGSGTKLQTVAAITKP